MYLGTDAPAVENDGRQGVAQPYADQPVLYAFFLIWHKDGNSLDVSGERPILAGSQSFDQPVAYDWFPPLLSNNYL